MITTLLLASLIAQTKSPTLTYTEKRVEGWRVMISPEAAKQKEKTAAVMALLTMKLKEITKVCPKDAVKFFKTITLWFDDGKTGTQGGAYHPSKEWLKGHGYNPDMAGGIEFGNLDNFIGWTKLNQPYMVLHELAHAYHFGVLGNDQRVLDVFKAAVESKKYEMVEYIPSGKKRHYALNNEKEFFAEATEAYFGKNDFYPFVRKDLAAFDPAAYKMIEECYGIKKSTN